jgi:hypothetical protein
MRPGDPPGRASFRRRSPSAAHGGFWYNLSLMKCEMCHQKDAATAIIVPRDGEEQELYVCRDCAKLERVRRQKQSQRTRKMDGLPPGVSISVTGVGGDGGNPPPILEAIMNAVHGMVSDMGAARQTPNVPEEPTKEDVYHDFPCARTQAAYRVGEALHLEGLNLIGELPAVHRALRALKMRLVGVTADGVNDTGHVFRVQYTGSSEQAKRVVEDILAQERNARRRLLGEMPRVFGDSVCRALAMLKNCRLLSPGEFYDRLSPLRLAAIENLLEGVTLREIERWLSKTDLSSREDKLEVADRDRIDAERADEMNRRFEDVILNERAEELFL